MDEKRIKIAESNFRNYLRDNLIKKEGFAEIVYKTYINNSLESLKVADELFKNKTSSLWVIVSSYYAMFYVREIRNFSDHPENPNQTKGFLDIASAYVYKKGYKTSGEIVHQIVNEALIILARHDLEKHFLEEYEEEKEKALFASGNLLKNYELEKVKRASFQYETTEVIKEAKAKTSLDRAKNFIAVMRHLLGE